MALPVFALYEGIIYGVLLIIGGIIGYLKAQSRPSLFMGSGSGALAIVFAVTGIKASNPLLHLFLLGALAMVLAAFCYLRFTTTNKFLPSGLMLIISLISAVIYVSAIIVV